MISIIICCRTQSISTDLSENIKKTIGCEYELIVINNSDNKYSIFEAYNSGIDKSKGEFLCFIHDDIFIHTNGWGNSVQRIFKEDLQIGLIGVAGSKVKTKMPSAWWDCPQDQKVVYILQNHLNKEKQKRDIGFDASSNIEVAVIDGVFMAMRKVDRIQFNSGMMGFHNYDLNISFQTRKQGYKIVVTKEILLEHFSSGTISEEWVQSTFKIHNLYNRFLSLDSSKNKLNKKLEVKNAKLFIIECLKYERIKIALFIWRKLFYLDPISNYHIKFWKIILKKYYASNRNPIL